MTRINFLVSITLLVLLSGCEPFFSNFGNETKYVSADLAGNQKSAGGLGLFATANLDAEQGASGNQQDIAREIEEADIVKLIGTRLYVLNHARGLRIIDVSDWSNPAIKGSYGFTGDPVEMYVTNNIASIIVRNFSRCKLDSDLKAVPSSPSIIYFVDVTDADSPVLIDSFGIDGVVSETRRVGDVIYLAGSRTNLFYGIGVASAEVAKASDSEGFIVSINIANAQNVQLIDEMDLPGFGEYIHATQDEMFIAGYDWENGNSTIQYVDISDPSGNIELGEVIEVPGQILNRFAMNAFDGYLRVVAQKRNWQWDEDDGEENAKEETENGVNLFVYDLNNPQAISLAGKLHIIDDEDLKAVRFDGEKGYVVTFFQVDPLWVIDISNPATPAITGQLEVPGYSTHLHPDGDYLIAVGIDDTSRWRASVMLYDVSNPSSPSELDRVILGEGYSSSEANYDEKALKVISDAKLILMPFDTWGKDGGKNFLELLDYSENKLTDLAAIEHRGTALRSGVEIAESILWIISQQALQTLNISDLKSPQQLAMIPIAENVIAWKKLGDYGLRLVVENDNYLHPKLNLQVIPYDSPNTSAALSSISMELFMPRLTVVNSDLAVISGTSTNDKVKIYTIDLQSLPNISILGEKEFGFALLDYWPVYPMHDDYRIFSAMPGCIVPPYRGWMNHQANPLLLTNGTLGFICRKVDWSNYNDIKLKLVSLSDPADPKIASSVNLYKESFDQIAKAGVSGNTIFCTLGKADIPSILELLASPGGSELPLARYYLKLIDCSNPNSPSVREPVNVPGMTIALKNNLIFTIDPQWQEDEITSWFCCGRLNDNEVTLLSKVKIGQGLPNSTEIANNTAAIILEKSYWYDGGIIPLKTSDEKCETGSFKLVGVDVSEPSNLVKIIDKEYSGDCQIKKMNGDYIVGISERTMQGMVWQMDDNASIALKDVIDLPGYIQDVSIVNDQIDLACGPSGIITVK